MSEGTPKPSGKTSDEPSPFAGERADAAPERVSTSGSDAAHPARPLAATLERLGAHTPAPGRYQLLGELARGGMGIIERVRDGDLGRTVARKILGENARGSSAHTSDPRTVGRFLEEAQVTAQLEHPGIVPVHELGLDERGVLYFTMRLVRGEDLHAIYAHVGSGAHGWNTTRALGVLLKACDALAFAHERGVVHRDLKPSNVMVGRFGEVYVMDWGLARVLDQPETKDVRPCGADELASAVLRSDRRAEPETPDSPLLTHDGDVIGTPAYMAPEQARGELERIGPRTDVYALGAMLYQLLGGRVPYLEPGERIVPVLVLMRVLEGPPTPLAELAPATPPELLAICERAMARDSAARYASVQELAEDLRAYLELRVVRAYRTGPLVELVKWVRRNRLSAASLAALVLVLAGSGFALAWQQAARRRAEERSALERTAESLVASLDELWPLEPVRIPRLDAWLADARSVTKRLSDVRSELAEFEAAERAAARQTDAWALSRAPQAFQLDFLESRRATFAKCLALLTTGERSDLTAKVAENELAQAPANRAVLELELPELERRIATMRADIAHTRTWRYADASVEQRYEPLARLAEHLERLARPDGAIAEIEDRLALATALARPLTADEIEAWRQAREAIAASPHYQGLALSIQHGLVPLGPDPRSGLWEFWHVLSGTRPERAANGAFIVTADTGIVLVLVPGGTYLAGSQKDDPTGPNYVPGLHPVDDWLEELELDPYFLSKYELTQGQWYRMTGAWPSAYAAGNGYTGLARLLRTQPVESVTWREADLALRRFGLVLPTEAQWERAARAGTQTRYATGATTEGLLERVNCLDAAAARAGWQEADKSVDDGSAIPVPVDTRAPDSWGFYALFGNVEEWCLDWYASPCERGRFRAHTGEQAPLSATDKPYRGGGFRTVLAEMGVATRNHRDPSSADIDIGVRPCRALDP